ncbi:MAG: hypothetical protein C4320_04045 [Armatimonadota bacterium]
MKSGEFDKKLHPEVLATAEEVAVSYETLMRARGEVSPGMERAQSAARAGLEEVVLVLAECSQPTPGMPPIVDVLQAAKVTIFARNCRARQNRETRPGSWSVSGGGGSVQFGTGRKSGRRPAGARGSWRPSP